AGARLVEDAARDELLRERHVLLLEVGTGLGAEGLRDERARAAPDLARDEVAELIRRRVAARDDHLGEAPRRREPRLDTTALVELGRREEPVPDHETRELRVLRAIQSRFRRGL